MKVLALFRRPETRRMDKGMDKGMEKERGPGRRPVEGDCGCHGFGRFLHIMKNDVYVGVGQVVSISKDVDSDRRSSQRYRRRTEKVPKNLY